MKDPYHVLGVSPSATQDEIKTAYRKLAREFHPDSDPGNPWIEDRFKEVSAAYDLLRDLKKREMFDRGEIGADGTPRRTTRPRGRAKGGGDPFDIFRRKRAAGANIRAKGANVSYTLTVDFREAMRGATKRVGMANGKHLEVRIPPGTRDGQTLRLKGQGMGGLGGGEPGDALIEITVRPDDTFRIDGDDVATETGISLDEAVLGARVEVETLDGPVFVTVPEGSNTGTRLRLRGRGLPRKEKGPDGSERGDHYVELRVYLPPKPDSELIAFAKRWGPKHPHPIPGRKAKSEV